MGHGYPQNAGISVVLVYTSNSCGVIGHNSNVYSVFLEQGLACPTKLGPSTLAVPEQLSNGGGKNVGHSPAESGTDF